MNNDIYIKEGIIIPGHELIITTSRAGGPGGQHVNKTSTRISIRWNIPSTNALTTEEKDRVIEKLKAHLTTEGDIIIHNSASRSQLQNKRAALQELARIIRNALYIPKKRLKTGVTKAAKEARLKEKKAKGLVKKMRGKIPDE